MRRRAIAFALLSAALFGASTPFAKLLVGDVAPLLLAGLLYLGSGVGLLAWLALRRVATGERTMPFPRGDLPWIAGAIACGGVLGPAALMYGLRLTEASAASLLLNLESLFTALIAWIAFRENVDRRVALGMLFIVAGGALLSWRQSFGTGGWAGPLLIAGACLAWALDNNLTRRASAGDAVALAGAKGLAAGLANTALALSFGASLPPAGTAAAAALLGLAGYGVSLVLFILALRDLGTARTGAYFAVAPFFGAILALAFLGETAGAAFWGAAALMAGGVWLHLAERHEHEHRHEALEHEHEHVHDEHHRHEHAQGWDGREPHSHLHRHAPLRHLHPHYPDLHHRHEH